MEFQILVGAGATVRIITVGEMMAQCVLDFLLGTLFSKNSKVLWFYLLSSVVGTWLALAGTSGAACLLLVLVGTF